MLFTGNEIGRVWATIIAQLMGVIAVFFVSVPLPGTEFGKDFIQYIALGVFLLTVPLGFYYGFRQVVAPQQMLAANLVSNLLLYFVTVDIAAITLLIWQEQGICSTLFLPVLFTVPTAFLLVEVDVTGRNRIRMLSVLLMVAAAIGFGFIVSLEHPTTMYLGFWKVPTSAIPKGHLHGTGFHWALLIATSVSLIVPASELLIAYAVQTRHEPVKAEPA